MQNYAECSILGIFLQKLLVNFSYTSTVEVFYLRVNDKNRVHN